MKKSIPIAFIYVFPIVLLSALAPVHAPGQGGGAGGGATNQYEQFNNEAKFYLSSLADAQVSYFAANNSWAGYSDNNAVFKALGWQLPESAHYAYYCGNDYILPQKTDYPFNYPDPKKNWPYGLFPEATLSDFVCMAIGNNDGDNFPDVWMIDKYKIPVHALDDATDKIAVNIVSEPLNAERYFTGVYENRNPKSPSRIYIEINVPAYRLDLYEDGRMLKSYPIAIGMKKYKTPLRDFFIEQIEWNPWWYPPDAPWTMRTNENGDKEKIKPKGPGPGNPLGPVKMVLQNAILLHGTNNPRSIGHMASHSCMRMYPDNAVDLAYKVMVLAGVKQPLLKKTLYRDGSRRTYIISLSTYVQVTTLYRRMEVYKNCFLLHPDAYMYQPLDPDDIKRKLGAYGIPFDSLGDNRDLLFSPKLKQTLSVPIRL